jgi:hypothetical protein
MSLTASSQAQKDQRSACIQGQEEYIYEPEGQMRIFRRRYIFTLSRVQSLKSDNDDKIVLSP